MVEMMRAIQIDGYGGPEVMVHREIAVPQPGAGELLVKLAWSGINFMDIHTRQGKYRNSVTYPVSIPTTIGIEGAGVIAGVGPEVAGFREGDRVAYCLSWGSYADYALVEAWRVVKVPAAVTLCQAAAAMFHGLTAHYLASDLGKGAPGVTWAIHAASGGIGQLLIQLGKRLGASVYAITSTEDKAAMARARGADAALLYNDGGFAEAVRELTDGKGVDVVFDPVGKPTIRGSLRAARKMGLVVHFGSVGGSVTDLDLVELGEAGSLFLTRPRLADYLQSSEVIRRRADDIFGAILDQSLTVTSGGVYELDDIEKAHHGLETRSSIGKPLLRLNPSLD